jgi:hypothetical protein
MMNRLPGCDRRTSRAEAVAFASLGLVAVTLVCMAVAGGSNLPFSAVYYRVWRKGTVSVRRLGFDELHNYKCPSHTTSECRRKVPARATVSAPQE